MFDDRFEMPVEGKVEPITKFIWGGIRLNVKWSDKLATIDTKELSTADRYCRSASVSVPDL
jgi:hypothetical protein